MPFENLDDLDCRESYINILKEELNALRASGETTDFYFLEKFRFDGKNADPILVLGKVSSSFVSELKLLPGDYTQGHCQIRGGELRVIPKRGRAPEPKLKAAIRGVQIKVRLIADVTGVAEEEEQSQRLEAERQMQEAQAEYDKLKKHIPPAQRRELQTMFGKYDQIFKTKDYAGAQKQLSSLSDKMSEMLKYSMRESRAVIQKREREQKRIGKKLEEVSALVGRLDKLAAEQQAQVARLRDGLAKVEPTRKNAEAILAARDRLAGHEKTVKQLAEQSGKAKTQLSADFDKLKDKSMRDPASQALATLAVAHSGRIKALEQALRAIPLNEAKTLLARAIKTLKEGVG